MLCVCRYEDCEKSGLQDGGHSSAVHGGNTCRSAIKLTSKISSKCCCHFSERTVSVSDGYLMRLQRRTLAQFKALVKPLILLLNRCQDDKSYVVLHVSVKLMDFKVSKCIFFPHGKIFIVIYVTFCMFFTITVGRIWIEASHS